MKKEKLTPFYGKEKSKEGSQATQASQEAKSRKETTTITVIPQKPDSKSGFCIRVIRLNSWIGVVGRFSYFMLK